jgi:hypothetical protein
MSGVYQLQNYWRARAAPWSCSTRVRGRGEGADRVLAAMLMHSHPCARPARRIHPSARTITSHRRQPHTVPRPGLRRGAYRRRTLPGVLAGPSHTRQPWRRARPRRRRGSGSGGACGALVPAHLPDRSVRRRTLLRPRARRGRAARGRAPAAATAAAARREGRHRGGPDKGAAPG